MRLQLFAYLLLAQLASAAVRPAAPVIIEPSTDHQILNAEDVHMVTGPMRDDDGDLHHCSDWEIIAGSDVVWSAPCVTRSLRTHIHLGDGVFQSPFVKLSDASEYTVRVRHRDDSSDSMNEWSEWSSRPFRTGEPSRMKALLLRDVLSLSWLTPDGSLFEVPSGLLLRLEAMDGELLQQLDAGSGGASSALDAPALPTRAAVRLLLTTSSGLQMPESDVVILDEEGAARRIYLPAVSLAPGESLVLHVSANGSTHSASAEDRAPRFEEIRRGAPVPYSAVRRGLQIDRFADGLELPVNLAFVPEPGDSPDSPLFYVTELYGNVKVVTRNGAVRDYATGLLNFDARGPFPGSGEFGLAGIVIEPETGDLIVTQAYLADPYLYVFRPRVLRLHSDDGGFTAATVTTVLDMRDEPQYPSHQISNISIGFDGKFYLHMGDGGEEGKAQDMTSYRGKILRFNRDGSAPPDNPFYDASDGIGAADYIFALGFRNPFGGAWRALDESLYEIENGPALDRLARVDRGVNYGWNGTDESMRNFAVCTFEGGTAPVNLTFVEPETFDGGGFPESFFNKAWIGESGPTWSSGLPFSGKRIEEVAIDSNGNLVSRPEILIEYAGTGKATVAGIAAGPDGVYFSSLYRDYGFTSPIDRGAAVFRVRWTGYAEFAVAADAFDALTIHFTDSSQAPQGSRLEWDFGDGATSEERNPSHRYRTPGTRVVRLRITGSGGVLEKSRKIDVQFGGSGLISQYFEDDGFSVSRFSGIDSQIDFVWNDDAPAPGVPVGEFSARWSGRIRPETTGQYRFYAQSDETVRVFIDGVPVVDDGSAVVDGQRASTEVRLEAGITHAIVVEYVHRTGPASLRLLWESEIVPRSIVPMKVLYPPSSARRRAVGGV